MNSRPTSNNLFWIVGAVVAASACVCGGFVLASSGLLLFAAPWRSVGGPSATPTIRPASVGEWQPLPDLPRKVNVFLFDPNDPDIAYAGTGQYLEGGSGLYRSADGGATWQLAVEGLPDEPVMALALSADSSVLYANLAVDTTLYASTDGARTWQPVGANAELCCNVPRVLRVAPDDSRRVYLAQTGADPNLSISADGGATWHRVADPRDELQPLTLAIDPADPAVLYLGTRTHGVYRSTDRGETWKPANNGLVDEAVSALVVSPTTPGLLYAGSERGHIYSSDTGGEAWVDLSAALALEPWERGAVLNLTLDASAPRSVIATLALAGLLQSPDGGATWERVAAPSARRDFPFPQDAVSARAPNGRILLNLYYPDGEESGAWLCVP